MADFGISAADHLIELCGNVKLKEICEAWGCKSQIEDFNKSVSTIKSVLLDAESRSGNLSCEAQIYVEELKDAVYDADDLFDEFMTLAEQHFLPQKSNSFSVKVRSFFSSKNVPSQHYRMSRKIKGIMKQLDAIADKGIKFGLSNFCKPILRRREETCSYVDAKELIGRDHDKDAILQLLDHDVGNDIRFVTIVGVGGSGKTALAQLVFNDERVKELFPLRLWVCVSDQDVDQLDVKAIICKILEVNGVKVDSTLSLESVQYQFQEQLRGKKFLIVLDDVWNEDREKWIHLKNILMLGQRGSSIVVTTRSMITAAVIGDIVYELRDLSDEDSWHLFKMIAFGREHPVDNELVQIGKNIVQKCCNVPLAIRVVGSLLYGQDLSRWQSICENRLARLGEDDHGMIMSILKLSYSNLCPSLKSCFTYCAVFPNDFLIEKEMLIGLWMAQGFIVPLKDDQSIEDAAEEHFYILLQRYFFQVAVKGEYGDVKYVRIHDLLQDVAREVGRHEICVSNFVRWDLEERLRHLRFVGDDCPSMATCKSRIRSFFWCHGKPEVFPVELVNCLTHLRVLDLSDLGVSSLPNSVGKLLLLRYLNLSYNQGLEALPHSIGELHNLQTLVLRGCSHLRKLPSRIYYLIYLIRLDLEGCDELSCMPPHMDRLTSLRVLPYFVVGVELPNDDGKLKDLTALTNIKGYMCIKIGKNYRIVENVNDQGGGYLKHMKHLLEVTVTFENENESRCVNHEVVMENLEPHQNLKGFNLYSYNGTTIPRWGTAENNWAISLFHLVKIRLTECMNLQEMPMLSKLYFLKSLELVGLQNLEYMENSNSSTSSNTEAAEVATFFPSLEFLLIQNLIKFKGWWKEDGSVDDDDLLLSRRWRFLRLLTLKIEGCLELTSFPPCPSLESLLLSGNNETLQIIVKITGEENDTTGNSQYDIKLREVSVDYLGYLKSLPTDCLTALTLNNTQMNIIEGDDANGLLDFQSLKNMKVLPEWICSFSSLQSLSLSHCPALKSLPEEMQKLTSLQRLVIRECPDLVERCKSPIGEEWPKIQHIPHIVLISNGFLLS